jgi:hypothetical protein
MTRCGPSPQRRLAKFEPPPVEPGLAEALDDFVARRTAAPCLWIEKPVGAASLRVVGTANACPKRNKAGGGFPPASRMEP